MLIKCLLNLSPKLVPCLSAENIDALFGILDWQLSEDPDCPVVVPEAGN